MSKNLMIFKSSGKEGGALSFGSKRSCLKKKKSGLMTQGRREMKLAILLLNNDKYVIAKNVLSYF